MLAGGIIPLFCYQNAMKLIIFLCILPITFPRNEPEYLEKDMNKPRKDKYFLHKTCELALTKHINEEKRARLTYDAMASHFGQNSVARPGFSGFFLEQAEEHERHMQKLIDYLNERSGKFSGFDVKMPTKYSWGSALEALRDAVDLEKHINMKVNSLHDIATLQCVDQHLMDYLEKEFLDVQVKYIDTLLRHISSLREMDTGMGEYFLDKQLSDGKTEL